MKIKALHLWIGTMFLTAIGWFYIVTMMITPKRKEQPEPQELKLCYPIKESTPINERQEIYFNSLIEEK